MSDFPFPGLNLALATPFDAQGQIDFKRLEQNIERHLAAGVRGFVISSGTGMHVYLSQEESRQLVERSAKLINGRAKLIVQTSALMQDEVVERTRHAKGCGADGVMVLPPFFEGPTSDDEIVAFYAGVAKGGLPIIGYNVPQVVGVAITPGLLGKLSAIPEFCGVKDSSGDFAAQASLVRTGLGVMNGADPLALYALYAGVGGLIWGGANFAPRSCVALVEAAAAKRWEDAREIWRTLEPSMSLIWAGDYVKTVYAAADLMGYGAGVPRRPLSGLAPERLDALRAALAPVKAREAA
ncbi:MAG: dihydrodipicolinate synthase family protein [Alphaproteobacteria bacterium]|nr:dihydrodipicolinate synthase family protein [Alphaproteobacteria bacterium]